MPSRRAVPSASDASGELSTYGRFKDRLTLMLVAMVMALIGFIVHDQVRGRSRDQLVMDARIADTEADLRQFKDRVNSQFDERLRMIASLAERTRAVETEQRNSRMEIIDRLERIEGKIDQQ